MKVSIFFKTALALFLFVLSLPGFAATETNNPPEYGFEDYRGDWQFLGARTVNHRTDRDVIHLHQGRRSSLSAIEFRTTGRNVAIRKAAIVYRNGHVQEIKFRKNRRSQSRLIVDLPRRVGAIDKIVIWSKARRGQGHHSFRHTRPEVEVWGLRSHRDRRSGQDWNRRDNYRWDDDRDHREDRRDRRNRR